MQLITDKLKDMLLKNPIGSHDGDGFDAPVIAKFFHPLSRYTLYVTEGELRADDSVGLLFGYCISMFDESSDEWGYTDFDELRSVQVRGVGMERDIYCPAGRFTVREMLERDGHRKVG